ncbi:MAG: RluA family pseudouridine synthase [Candidatus Sericytochromatia bacterium]|nr:RluA family pseudouridine synthase [Candidatus Sericytochromatia bacterium]
MRNPVTDDDSLLEDLALNDDSDSEAWTVEADSVGERLDIAITQRLPGLTRTRVQQLVAAGQVTLNDKPTKPGIKLRAGETVSLTIPPLQELTVMAENIPLSVIYEDSDLLVINKPKGMVVHPAPGHLHGTLVNALLYHCLDLSGIGGMIRPGIVHRLDKDTSGLLMVAKNDLAHQSLAAQIAAKTARRMYRAIVVGSMEEDSGEVDAPIGRHPVDRQRMAILSTGRHAKTYWRVLDRFSGYTDLAIELGTGRTHQIRVHLASLKRPVVGDIPYGGGVKLPVALHGQVLHASELRFVHPRTQAEIICQSPLPEEYEKLLRYLKQTRQ